MKCSPRKVYEGTEKTFFGSFTKNKNAEIHDSTNLSVAMSVVE